MNKRVRFTIGLVGTLGLGFGAFVSIRDALSEYSYWFILWLLALGIWLIGWTINPFSISASWIQLILSMILGLWYGIAYKESKSIIYPMAMHSIWNVVMVGARYIHLALLL